MFKRGNAGQGMYANQDIPSSLDNTNAVDDTCNMSSLATIEREIRDKMTLKEQKIKEIEQRRRLDLMSCSSSSSSVLTIPPQSTIDKD